MSHKNIKCYLYIVLYGMLWQWNTMIEYDAEIPRNWVNGEAMSKLIILLMRIRW